MSINDLIKDKVTRGMLYPVYPRTNGDPIVRPMFVSEELNRVLNSGEGSDEWEERVANLQADLEVFVTGSLIHHRFLFLLYPGSEAVWEIRSVGSNPSIRVLGLFAAKDIFIATNFALREDLGGWQSREWKDVKRKARREWSILFHTYLPINSYCIHDLVTGAIDGRYFKD